ncbi:MAG: HD domain-containing protein [Planctomycetota bacterium]
MARQAEAVVLGWLLAGWRWLARLVWRKPGAALVRPAASATTVAMPRTFLADAETGSVLDDVFVITNPQLGTTRKGDPFIKLLVSDRTMQVPGKWWQMGPETLAKLPKNGAAVRVKGLLEEFNDSPQFRVDNIWPVDPADVDYADLLPSTEKNVDELLATVESILATIEHPDLRALTAAYLRDERLMTDFKLAPAAMAMHHAYLGGLLEHTCILLQLADAVCPLYPDLDRDTVVFGLFVHDLAKTWELKYDVAFGYTDGGNLVGHIVKAALWLEDKAREVHEKRGEPIDRRVMDILQNLLLSHHGLTEQDYGSARNPMTPEAIMVHMLDTLDAKLMPALELCRSGDTDATMTDFSRSLGTRLYRPSIAQLGDEPARPAGDQPIAPPPKLDNPLFGS